MDDIKIISCKLLVFFLSKILPNFSPKKINWSKRVDGLRDWEKDKMTDLRPREFLFWINYCQGTGWKPDCCVCEWGED